MAEITVRTSRPGPDRTSDVLAAFRRDLPDGRVSIGNLIDALGDRSVGTILLALSLPTVAPVPLGVSVLFNLPVLLFSIALLFGSRGAMLPDWLLRRSVERATAARMIDAVLPRLRWIERMLRPRRPALAAIDGEVWFGALVFLLALIAFVPVPLMGWLPGFALVLLALGLIERDGNAVGVGLVLGMGAVVFAAILISGLSYAGHELLVKDEAD
ncbi:exopolysaccharide biosynthesis protein [Azospirillum halopraeferens]|uniref:exopolysaccharide biosynthesis protein n=1 Tax=Azospirillum halopraeferens TaxID=34010 RepID=UPI00041915BA|nr:exopolysaccharide biosynthesis protein [Azospirillum halopraeferens]